MLFFKKYFLFIKPGIKELLILGLFISGTACLETDNVFSALSIYTDATYDSRKMVEANGYLYIANNKLHIIEQINITTGAKVVWAGSSGTVGATDGTLTNARFNAPSGIAFLPGVTPKLYVVERTGCTLREININAQTVTTVAGASGVCSNVDATGLTARFGTPTDIVIVGASLYVSQLGCNIRKVDLSTFQVTSPIGTYNTCGITNGTGTAASFGSAIYGLTVVGNTLFVADTGNFVIRAVNLGTLAVTTFSGAGTAGSADGNATTAQFNFINAITSDGSTTIFVSDFSSNAIRQVNASTGAVTTIIGSTAMNQDIDGVMASAKMSEPLGVTFSIYGLFISNFDNVRRLH